MTLAQARYRLQRKSNWSSIDTGTLNDLLNEACEILLTYSRPFESKERIGIKCWRDIITLPRQYCALLGLLRNHLPQEIRNGWIEFTLAGPGDAVREDLQLQGECIDLGDGYCCAREPHYVNEDGCLLKFYTDAAAGVEETESIIEIEGLDANGDVIRTTTGTNIRNGEAVTLLGATGSVTTTESFYRITKVVKPITKGVISVYAIDPDDASENWIGEYQPGETNPSYRRYKCPQDPDGTDTYTPIALVRKHFVEAIADNDELSVSSFPALIDALIFINYRDQADDERAQRALNRALITLTKQSVKSAPPAQYPPIINDIDNSVNKTFQGY